MKKRLLVTALWFYAVWYAWSIVAVFTGMTGAIGPLVALVLAGFVGWDPAHRIWNRRPAPAAEPVARAALEPDAV